MEKIIHNKLVENKQRFISQIMTSKTPVRFAEDIDETALSYAEIKALAAGNPDIIEKTELDTQVAKLKLLKQTHLSEIYALEDKVIKYYPNEIKRLENRIEDMKEDIEVFNNNNTPDNSFDKMNIKDDPRSNLLESLKPYLKESRRSKVDQYIQLMNISRVMEVFPFMGGDNKNASK